MLVRVLLFLSLWAPIVLVSSSGQNIAPAPSGDTPRAAQASPAVPSIALNLFPDSPLPMPRAGLEPPAASVSLVRTTIHVSARSAEISTDNTAPMPYHVEAAQILSSAGTYGDLSRYLQLFPGVVSTSDVTDEILVRGGNPAENLYLVDGIAIPNINHIAIEGTTGGLVSMIDTAAMQSLDFYTGGYDASYEERLSSVVDIHTRELADRRPHLESDFGFVGAGGVSLLPLGQQGSLLISAHHSIVNLFTNDIGIDGVPTYTNLLIRAQLVPSSSDQLTLLSLSGVDSLDITPCDLDADETLTIETQYSGWRTTNGLRWRHIYSPTFFAVLTASDSEQQQDVDQQDQFYQVLKSTRQDAQDLPLVPVYSESSHDGRATLKYDTIFAPGRRWSLMAGTAGMLNRVDYRIAQPLGEQSPLTINPAASDAVTFAPSFLSGETGSYAELTIHPLARWSISSGGRLQSFALGGHLTATSRLHSALRLSPHTGLHAAWGDYAQMPPTIYITAWPQNHELLPIRVRHIVVGADLYSGRFARLAVEAYRKNYSDYPVSTEFPSLSLANVIQTSGQQFLWIPLSSQGTGLAQGVELSSSAHIASHLSGQASIAWARAKFAALDEVLRPGNFDYPLIGNASGSYDSGKRYEASWRYEYTSGHPYTPFLLDASMQQNRPIYDLSRLNAVRGPVYSRFDFQFDRSINLGSRRLILYGGLNNAWNRKNFFGDFWMPRVDAYSSCHHNPENCVTVQYETPRMPNFGARYIF